MDRKYGYIKDKSDARDLKFAAAFPVLKDLPRSTQMLLNHLPPKVNQLSVGMCTGAGSTRAAKAFMNRTGYPYPHTPSALYLYAMTRIYENTPLTEDSGAMIRDVFRVWNRDGVCPEDSNPTWSWPFSASDNRWQLEPPPICKAHAANHKITYMRLNNNEKEIKSALAQGFPIVIGIAVYESFESKKVAETGVIPKPGRHEGFLGGHCMFLFDYGNYKSDYADGVNSWGDDWGDGGNFHIPFSLLKDPEFTSDLWAITGIS